MRAKVDGTICRLCNVAIAVDRSEIFPWGFHDETLDAPLHSLPLAAAGQQQQHHQQRQEKEDSANTAGA